MEIDKRNVYVLHWESSSHKLSYETVDSHHRNSRTVFVLMWQNYRQIDDLLLPEMRLCICEICMFVHVGPNDSIKQIEHTIASFVVLDALRMRLTISCCFGIRYSRFHSNTTATRQSTTWFNHFRDRRERVSELRCSHAIRTRISLKYVERTQSAVHGQLTSCICVCVSTDLVSAVFIAFMSPNSIHLLL